jgi:hypothetical protein
MDLHHAASVDTKASDTKETDGHLQHRYAKRDGEWVDAITELRCPGAKYTCDCPGGGHAMKLRQWRGIAGTRGFTSHFSLINSSTSCTLKGQTGESEAHVRAKHLLRVWMMTPGRVISIVETTCSGCSRPRSVRTFNSSAHDIELERVSDDKQWRYDCIVKGRSDGVPVYAIEVVVTHYSSREKLESTRNDGLGIAEIMAECVAEQCASSLHTIGFRHRGYIFDRQKCARCLRQEQEMRDEAERVQKQRALKAELDALMAQRMAAEAAAYAETLRQKRLVWMAEEEKRRAEREAEEAKRSEERRVQDEERRLRDEEHRVREAERKLIERQAKDAENQRIEEAANAAAAHAARALIRERSLAAMDAAADGAYEKQIRRGRLKRGRGALPLDVGKRPDIKAFFSIK